MTVRRSLPPTSLGTSTAVAATIGAGGSASCIASDDSSSGIGGSGRTSSRSTSSSSNSSTDGSGKAVVSDGVESSADCDAAFADDEALAALIVAAFDGVDDDGSVGSGAKLAAASTANVSVNVSPSFNSKSVYA